MQNTIDVLDLDLNLEDIDLQEIELFLQAGSKGMPEFAASCSRPKETPQPKTLTDEPCCTSCGTCKNSCSCGSGGG